MGPEIVAFIGVVGAGKDYNADKLVSLSNFKRVDFKDELLEMASDIAGYNVREDYDWFKSHIVGLRRPSKDDVDPELKKWNVEADALLQKDYPCLLTGRRLLQRLGTETMRKRDKDCWVKTWKSNVSDTLLNGGGITVADCRFPNEVAAICFMSANRKFIFCDYRSERYNPNFAHESEWLAQELLKAGYKDGREIDIFDLQAACGKMSDKIDAKEKLKCP